MIAGMGPVREVALLKDAGDLEYYFSEIIAVTLCKVCA